MRTLIIATAASLMLATTAMAQDAKYDTDGDEVLSPEEFAGGPMNLGNFDQFDSDSNGSVDLSEFMAGIADKLRAMRDDGTLTPRDAREIQQAVMAFN